MEAYGLGRGEGVSNRKNWNAANERLVYFLKELADEGYPDDLLADATMALGVVLIDQVYGRDVLLAHLTRVALKAADPNADMSNGPRLMQ
jgi:hypothetical protein